jgi:hypothetical protein
MRRDGREGDKQSGQGGQDGFHEGVFRWLMGRRPCTCRDAEVLSIFLPIAGL